MLRAILNKSWKQHPTKQQLFGHLLPVSKKTSKLDEQDTQNTAGEERMNIQVTFSYGPLHTEEQVLDNDLQQLCSDTGCSLEDLLEVMNDRDEWREKVWEIRSSGMTWWWWWWWWCHTAAAHDYTSTRFGWFVGFYGISTFVSYLTPNPFLCK